MSKKPVSLEAQLAGHLPTDTSAAQSGENVVAFTPASKPAIEKATVYLPRAAMKRLKQMALDQDKRINDFLQEGVDLMFAKHGQPSLKEFEEKK
ncbi:ribbon-helix-helix domain-containing protein [Rhizobium halophilum]|uniref:ribbon-helix-helix domain-containing protein n=1 Tax=Rhizobium halophilum TaxID=2846852 RepID=UPI001EFC2FA1|nr:ribbon-helix-helix domain-containing protein [Rhizobium halophilum]MCF6371255.1 hypothetical protein [Rhizobium halophilum]